MTETNPVIIYEFRSGFTYQSCGNSWRSTGFYGSPYIGHTFDDGFIPELLQRAARREDSRLDVSQKIDYESFINLPHQSRDLIGFKEFNDRFVRGNALVGRIIEEWAVLAVVSVAIDFSQRRFPVKRYFCCQESYDGNYDAMATLVEFFFNKRPENLTFDILENKPPQSYKVSPFSSQDLQLLDCLNCDYSMSDGLHLLKPGLDMNKNNLLRMWKTCLNLVGGDRKKAAWAFNVDSVANPTDFTLIQAGTKEFFHRNYSEVSPQLLLSQYNQEMTAKSVFNDFAKNGNLSQEKIKFITTDIQQNYEQWEKLATKNRYEITTEFKSFSSIIRYYTLSALIVPERAVDLFQQLLFSQEDIWKVFLNYAKCFKRFYQRNDTSLKNSIEEGVWLIINYILEGRFELPPQKIFWLYQPGKLKRFFTEEDNIWKQGIFWSIHKSLLSKSSYTGQQQESSSSSFQTFYHNLDNEQYRKSHKKGYEKITQIFSQISKNTSHNKIEFLFICAVIEQKFQGKVSHRLYSKLGKYAANHPSFSYLVKETTIWDNLYQILNLIQRKVGRRSLQRTRNRNRPQINRTPSELVQEQTVVNAIFKDFVENGNLSQEKTEFITTDIQQNYEQWEKLATKSRDEIIREFKSFSSIIRYYTLSALIVPEIAVDLFQQLLVSQEDIWDTFLTSAKYKYFPQKIQNDPYFKNSIEEGVWLILNNIVEGGFLLLPEKHFRLRLYQLVKLKRFFTEKDNIWIKGIWWSIQKFILSKSSNTGQQQESSSSSFQIFYRNLEDEQYRKRHIKGYEKITQIFSQISNNISHDKKTDFLFFQALIEQKLKGKVSHRIYSTLNKKARNYPLFSDLVKKTTIWDNLCQILNRIGRKIYRRPPQPNPSRNPQQVNRTPVDNLPHNTQNTTPANNYGNRRQTNQNPVDNVPQKTENSTPPNNTKILLIKMTIIVSIFAALSITTTIILGFLKLELEIFMSFLVLALLLIVIAFFLFMIQELMND